MKSSNIKGFFPTLLEFLDKYDAQEINPNVSINFKMEIP